MVSMRAVFVIGALVIGASVAAEESQKLRWGVGGGFVSSPRPYVDAKSKTFPIPVVNFRYQRWFVQGIRGGYELLSTPKWNVSSFAQARFQGLEPEDSPFLEGMERRRTSMDGGVEVVYRGRPVGFRAAALTDVLGKSNGQDFNAQAVTGAPLGKRLLVLAGFGPRWQSARFVDYYYGVGIEEATSMRPAYEGQGTLSWDLAFSAIYRPLPRWSLFALWNRTTFGEGIRQSPTVDRDAISSFVLFVTRDF
ncbi:MAG TPA: MipA/OmpV family protein [Vicinamibacteria bacterium]|nr:MipA/OmpV family protein [Vicinamibacteria bacterium]